MKEPPRWVLVGAGMTLGAGLLVTGATITAAVVGQGQDRYAGSPIVLDRTQLDGASGQGATAVPSPPQTAAPSGEVLPGSGATGGATGTATRPATAAPVLRPAPIRAPSAVDDDLLGTEQSSVSAVSAASADDAGG